MDKREPTALERADAFAESLGLTPTTPPTLQPHEQSPEKTGRYECQHCGNRERFTGHDDRGYPGDIEDHDAGCPLGCEDPPAGAYCTCEVTLTQTFRVEDGEPYDYDSHEGGGSGAEIGSYTRIDCGACGLNIWTEPNHEEG